MAGIRADMTEPGEGRLGRRLKRILLLLPYAIKHPGVTLDELATKFSVKKKDLMDDLNLVFLCGLPGYGPGDLIDVSIEEDRVFIRMADYFGAPFRLTPAEALALYAGGAALVDLPGMEEAEALKRALAKLGHALGVEGGGDAVPIEVKLEGGADEHLDLVRRAVTDRKKIHIHYRSTSRAELSERVVEPWGLVAALGHWYVVGMDHLSGEERMFRLDRVKQADLLDEPAEIPEDFDPGRYRNAWTGGDGALRLELEISPEAARWFGDYYPTAARTVLPDGWEKVELDASGEAWAATLLVKLGRDVRAVAPQDVADAARRVAESIVSRYEDGGA